MKEFSALFLFSGIGGGAVGFLNASEQVRGMQGRFVCCGAIDHDPAAAEDFEALTGVPCTVADLSTMTPIELRRACTSPPDVVFTSPPCKGFSGCLPTAASNTPRYQEMNDLAIRGLWLALEAWPEKPPRLILMENVPRIQQRGREVLDTVIGMLSAYGYACRETTHDCGELGGLGQRRRRFLLVARRRSDVANFWFTPPKRPLRSIGDVIGGLPVPWPDSKLGGPMHRLPRLSALNWLRLALIPPGGDWRSLPEAVRVVARAGRQNGGYGVEDWSSPAHSVLAEGSVANTRASVADPRPTCKVREGAWGVSRWDRAATTVIGKGIVQNGPWQVADPRMTCDARRGSIGVQRWDSPANTIVGAGNYWHGHNTADPRAAEARAVLWIAVDGSLCGAEDVLRDFDLQDPRPLRTPPILIAADNSWHRPLTTLELAALQGFASRAAGEWLCLSGQSHERWRERIGNAVPPPAAEAIAVTALRTLLVAEVGVWELGGTDVWVREVHI